MSLISMSFATKRRIRVTLEPVVVEQSLYNLLKSV